MAITMNGVWKKLCLQVIHDFLGSEKVGEESKEVFSNSVSLSEKLQSASATAARGRLRWTPCCAHKEFTDEDPMKLEAQRKDEEGQGEGGVTEEIQDAGNGKGIFFIWWGIVSFWGTGSEHRTVQKGCISHSECNPGLPCYLWWEKELQSRHYWIILSLFFFSPRESKELNPARNQKLCHQPQAWVNLQFALHLLVLRIFQLQYLPSLPPPVGISSCLFTGCQSLDASCYTVLLDFARYCTVKNTFFIFCSCFYVLFVGKVL